MGLINKTDKQYYEGNDLGSYQFVSLDDVISQFMAVYVGDEKIINKVSRSDVSFWAQRALAELSFDTLKSIKSQQIDLPPSLTMRLPKDYVNYTHLSYVDASGIKHPLYPTKDTNNPFQITQDEDKEYLYNEIISSGINLNTQAGWYFTAEGMQGVRTAGKLTFGSAANTLKISQAPRNRQVNSVEGFVVAGTHILDVSAFEKAIFSASATTVTAGTQVITQAEVDDLALNGIKIDGEVPYASTAGTYDTPATTVRVGLSTRAPSNNVRMTQWQDQEASTNLDPAYFDIGYLEWSDGETGEKTLDSNVDFTSIQGQVFLSIIVIAPWTDTDSPAGTLSQILNVESTVSNISLEADNSVGLLDQTGAEESSTFTNYKQANTSEKVVTDDYIDDIYWPNEGERYGLDPVRAQVNGSFYIDERLGKINFSSNISGKTVILDYISDSLGTDSEMQVHKFAEEALYKWITYGVLSTKSNVPEMIVRRAKKEKFAATRQAKLRLSNVKLGEMTQILRGKSKQIKH